jgi:hypothetical protein
VARPLSKDDLIRRAWVTELRRQGHRQCRFEFFKGNKVCAMGLLVELTGAHYGDPKSPCTSDVMGLAGLTRVHVRTLMGMNDEGKASFAEIADQIEEWFPVRRRQRRWPGRLH